jgi:hypothetical protein
MAYVSPTFVERWKSRQHVGAAAPTTRVTITRGLIDKGYQVFEMLDGKKPLQEHKPFFHIVKGKNHEPWQGFWRATGEPIELPNVSKVSWSQKLSDKGGRQATIEIENTFYKLLTGAGGIYHQMARGYLSPTLGAKIAGRVAAAGAAQNEWFEVLDNGYKIDVYEGYGDQQVHTYTGLIDHTDLDTHPDKITITSRSFWMVFTDQRVMGSNKAPEINGPKVTFADVAHTLGPKRPIRKPNHWVLIDDLAGMVKTVFMWGGFKEWKVENLGWSLVFPMSWTMEKFFIDMLEDATKEANWLVYEESPSSRAATIGVACFKHNTSTDKAPVSGMWEFRDQDMLEAVKPKYDLSILPFIIRSRGAVTKNGYSAPGELIKRCQGLYYPPWSGAAEHYGEPIAESGRVAGIRRHDYMVNMLYLTEEQCKYAAVLSAQRYALESATCDFQIAGFPGVELNTQVSVVSNVTGVNSRVWVSEIQSEKTVGKGAEWKMTIAGSLLDTVDLQFIAKDLASLHATVKDQKLAFT